MGKYHKLKEQEKKKKTYILTNEDIERIKEQERIKAMKDIEKIQQEAAQKAVEENMPRIVQVCLGVSCKVLNASFRWGNRSRIPTFCNRWLHMFQAIGREDGTLTPEMLIAAAEELGKIKFQ